MMFLVIANVPLLYFLNEDWFHTLLFTTPGKNRFGNLRSHYPVCPDPDHETEQAH